MALAKNNRLKSRADFEAVKKKGRLIFTPFFSLLVLATEDFSGPKFGFIVSKRIDKRAVVRNKLRRMLARVSRELTPSLKPNLHLVFLAKVAIKQAEEKDLTKLLRGKLGEYAEIKKA